MIAGRMGSVSGVIVGAVLIAGFPQAMQTVLGSELVRYRYLLFGLALIVVILFRPQGLIPSRRRAGT